MNINPTTNRILINVENCHKSKYSIEIWESTFPQITIQNKDNHKYIELRITDQRIIAETRDGNDILIPWRE